MTRLGRISTIAGLDEEKTLLSPGIHAWGATCPARAARKLRRASFSTSVSGDAKLLSGQPQEPREARALSWVFPIIRALRRNSPEQGNPTAQATAPHADARAHTTTLYLLFVSQHRIFQS